MTLSDYLTTLLSTYIVLPAAILCFAPMKNQLRGKPARIISGIGIPLLLFIAVIAYVQEFFDFEYNTILPSFFIIAFICYYFILKVPFYKSFAVYLAVFAFTSFFSNFANIFDAIIYPESKPDFFSFEAAIFQDVITTVGTAAVFYPVQKYGCFVVDNLEMKKVWYMTIPISAIFLLFNLIHVPDTYADLYVGNAFSIFLLTMMLLFILMCLLCVAFYFIVREAVESARIQERNRILELQESVYHSQERYLEDTARVRHDFRHTIYSLNNLAKSGDFIALQKYLDDYVSNQPQNETVQFCSNLPLNALLNYYMQIGNGAEIKSSYDIVLSDNKKVTDTDLCSVIGNILENAIHACKNIPETERFIDLVIRQEPDDKLFIVSSNSFDGNIKKKDGRYTSTHKKGGHGIGLRSIESIAEQYGGSASFRHEGKEFYIDVVL